MTPAPNAVPTYPVAADVLFWTIVAIFALIVVFAIYLPELPRLRRPKPRDVTPPPDLVPRDQLDDALAANRELRQQRDAARDLAALALRTRRTTL